MTMNYEGHTIETERVKDYHENPSMPHELFAIVDGERVVSASELEAQGYTQGKGWHIQLKKYAMAYVDGMESTDSTGLSIAEQRALLGLATRLSQGGEPDGNDDSRLRAYAESLGQEVDV